PPDRRGDPPAGKGRRQRDAARSARRGDHQGRGARRRVARRRPEGALPTPRQGRRHGVDRRQRAVRAARKGRRSLRGRRQRDQRHRHRERVRMDPTLAFPLLVCLIGVALFFDFLNGLHDAANSIATIVSTRVLRPQYAVFWAAFFNFIAFLFFGLHVAETIGRGIVSADIV